MSVLKKRGTIQFTSRKKKWQWSRVKQQIDLRKEDTQDGDDDASKERKSPIGVKLRK